MTANNQNLAFKHFIDTYDLEKHIEGGYFRRVFSSENEIKHKNKNRKACSTIYYGLQGNDISRWHRLSSDEIWHFYEGDSPVLIHCINPEGKYQIKRLGRPEKQAEFMVVVPAGCWFAAELEDKAAFAFMGCTVSPGFEYEDFDLADTNQLAELFPALKDIIEKWPSKR